MEIKKEKKKEEEGRRKENPPHMKFKLCRRFKGDQNAENNQHHFSKIEQSEHANASCNTKEDWGYYSSVTKALSVFLLVCKPIEAHGNNGVSGYS